MHLFNNINNLKMYDKTQVYYLLLVTQYQLGTTRHILMCLLVNLQVT